MKKHFFVFFAIVVAISGLYACASNKIPETTSDKNTIPQESSNIVPTLEDEITFSDKNNSFTVDNIPSEKELLAKNEPTYTEAEQFLLIASDELGIGFNNYGTLFELHDDYMIINYPNSTKGITQMFASNEFLNNHKIEFIAPEDSNLCTFVPKTFESLGFGYVEDDPSTWGSIGECYGCVWESSLDNHLGIKWEYGAPIEIVIDDKYSIFINKEFEDK